MKTCNQCKCDMIENLAVRIEGRGFGINIATGKGILAEKIATPKAAVCPQCGEVSLYIENPDELQRFSKTQDSIIDILRA